ncbi:MAG: urease accessory protein UreD [Cyanobacteria bacterium J06631_9]
MTQSVVVERSHEIAIGDVQPQLRLGLTCDAVGKTVVCDRYMAYPLSVSPPFRLDSDGTATQQRSQSQRMYLYRMNTSPGLLAGDRLDMSVQLEAGAQLLLADQAATKVHMMPAESLGAVVRYRFDIYKRATLEFLPEPLILFADSLLAQTTEITMHPSAGLSFGEIVLPGRLARGESYQFRQFNSRIRIKSPDGRVWFVDAMRLLGQDNPFVGSELFASGAVLGTLILVLPEAISTMENLARLSQEIDAVSAQSLSLASSVLPGGRGLLVRAIASKTQDMQTGFKAAMNCVRSLRKQCPLPYSI